jgi:hypothetical protein
MHSSAWAALLRHIPGEVHHHLMVVTTSGTEICLQTILRVDHEFLAFKGRLAGSQDAGRLFFLTYDRIDYLGFQQSVKESEFHEMFDALAVPAPPAPAGEPAPAAGPAAQGPSEALAPPPAGAGPAPIKSVVLERFRARGSTPGSGVRPPVGG